MDDFFLSLPISETKNICIAPVAATDFATSGIPGLGDDYGLFVYETLSDDPTGGMEILAKLSSREAAERFAEILEAAVSTRRLNRPAERYLQEPIDDL